MHKYLFIIITALFFSCTDSKNKKETTTVENLNVPEEVFENDASEIKTEKNPHDFIPKGFVAFDTIYGDLNNDNIEDCILIIKGTDKSKIIKDESRGQLDRNRRGIIVLLKKNNNYELAIKNYSCFSSENEDGGVYYAPELSVEIDKEKLYFSYSHGRYGYWSYTFRFQNNDFELIGFDSSSSNGPVIDSDVSINFLTRTKIVNVNTNENAESGDEVFEKTVTKIKKSNLIKLSEIKDFDELDVLK